MNPRLAGLTTTTERLKEMLKEHESWLQKVLTDHPQTSLMPTLLLVAKTGPTSAESRILVAIHGDWNDHNARHATMRRLGRDFHKERLFPVAAIMASEAWAAPNVVGKRPSEHAALP